MQYQYKNQRQSTRDRFRGMFLSMGHLFIGGALRVDVQAVTQPVLRPTAKKGGSPLYMLSISSLWNKEQCTAQWSGLACDVDGANSCLDDLVLHC
ncbi:hypothetical protein EVAR_88260_1 [Eumeta japonica]|uniref:Uncharacterized protein n=1 Tax=Eumeta variegata TaxID=151549 RepID=A0A4C1XLH8_EUMVA|nr:hypothetical protein EVAR_88260_1 [Eumeta japonica]